MYERDQETYISIVFRIGNHCCRLAIKLLFAAILLIDYAHKHAEMLHHTCSLYFCGACKNTKLKYTLSWVKKFQRSKKVMHHLVSDDVFVSNVWIISVPEMVLYKKKCVT